MKALLTVLFIALFWPLYLLSQKPSIQLEIDPKVIVTNDVFSITVRSNINGEIEIELPDEYIHGYNVMNGMEQDVDYATGKIITYYYVSQTGTFRKPGTYKIGPAILKKGAKTFKSNTVSIQVNRESGSGTKENDLTAKQLRQPAFGIIKTSSSKIYAGEPLVVNAKIYSRFDPTHLESYKSYTVPGALEKHDLMGGSSRIVVEEEYVKRSLFYTFEHDKKVVFPEGTGKLIIDPFRLILRRGLDGVPITSSPESVEILPLPRKAPATFTGGVGEFSINRTISPVKTKEGDVITVELTVKGTGNLHAIDQPKLNLPAECSIYGDPIIKEDFIFGDKGAEGSIAITYHVKVNTSGKLNLPGTAFSYFDPNKEKYITIRSTADEITIDQNPNLNTKDEFTEFNASNEGSAGQTTIKTGPQSQSGNENTWSKWLLIGTPISLLLIGGVLWWSNLKGPISPKTPNVTVERISAEAVHTCIVQSKINFNTNDYSGAIQHLRKGLILGAARYLHSDNTAISPTEISKLWESTMPDDPLRMEWNSAMEQCNQALYSAWNNVSDMDVFFNNSIAVVEKMNG
jgi:hypothetical protein